MADLEFVVPADNPEPKPKRKYTRRKKWNRKPGLKLVKEPLAPLPAEPPAMDLLAGLTHTACAFGCNVERCVITGQNICGHPHLQGLQEGFQRDKDVLARFKRAQLHLHHLAAEQKG